MVTSTALRSLLLLSLSAQALTASDLSATPSKYHSHSTPILPRATDLNSMMLGSSYTLTTSSIPTTFTTMEMTVGSEQRTTLTTMEMTVNSEPSTMSAMPARTKRSQVKKRCFILDPKCTDGLMDTSATVTSSVVTVYMTADKRDSVPTLSPVSMDQRQYVKVNQDKVAVNSIAGRSQSGNRHNSRRSYRSEKQQNRVRTNDDVKENPNDNPEKA